MIGAIVGDIVGSIYEWDNIKTKDFTLFAQGCSFTDDTVMTVATADALMNGGATDDFIDAYQKWGRLYPDAGYGGRFYRWIFSDERKAYNSWGNGSAMRVSPCAWLMGDAPEAPLNCWGSKGWNCARACAEVTHNHPEGVKGAQATAAAIFLCRKQAERKEALSLDALKTELKALIEGEFGYDLSMTLDEIRPSYGFDVSCQGTVPPAIIAFLESTGFEDAIRNAISLGGDSDTLAAITGSIAEAAYGVPAWIRDKALAYLDKPLRETYERWMTYTGRN